ncbi:MAG: glycosyltransferase [Chlamydiae bacterium]|nr:glycosyltransferase [Chlamydiota bacterium]
MKIYALVPCLYNEVGHHYSYHLAMTKAMRLNGWEYIKLIPKRSILNNLGPDWQKTLSLHGGQKGIWNNFFKPLANFPPFFKLFFRLKKPNNNQVVFLEYFTIIHLMLASFLIFFIRPKIQLWLLYRTDLDQIIFKGKAHRFLHVLLKKALKKQNVKLFTDSELLAKQLSSFFKKNVQVLPIPHTNSSSPSIKVSSPNEILCWWPGGSIRKEKGFYQIKRLVNRLKTSSNIKLILADSMIQFVEKNTRIQFIKSNLSEIEYNDWMIKADLILLPYISELYRYRTSGIFVEAIVAGAMPVVTKDTWMEYELKKFDLEELVIFWSSNDIIKIFHEIHNNVQIKEKFKIMREHYIKFHSIQNFASLFKNQDFRHF